MHGGRVWTDVATSQGIRGLLGPLGARRGQGRTLLRSLQRARGPVHMLMFELAFRTVKELFVVLSYRSGNLLWQPLETKKAICFC